MVNTIHVGLNIIGHSNWIADLKVMMLIITYISIYRPAHDFSTLWIQIFLNLIENLKFH